MAAGAVGRTTGAVLGRRNPVAKLGAAFIPALTLLVGVDPVSSGLILIAALLSVPAWGLTWREVFRRGWPLLLGVTTISLGNALFTARKGGAVLVDAGPFLLTTESVAAGSTAGMRLAAIALPGVLAVLTIDPVDLADSLVRHLKVPARFAYGSLAALRLAPLMATEWEILGRARRARGLEPGGNPLAAIRLFGGKLFALLVGAVRRGSQLAVAMDARGFDSQRARTTARISRFGPADAVLLGCSVALTAAAVALAVVTGAWNPVFSS
ncbi:energy-coupling factor transporter transmembrane protein EcfT [Phytoactinopolyspora alkaliphila]|uniref:Energy-coupling factor transporter transmembrane protein EcfT n=1 Tax=Phytoactinopolyspora alkaliphila TaxID=1783498 RepID=A0A6N9YQ83_9ACTN|nr:energy-coupling factor transporter transmembrane protein EcfT [Phytoactinopolyspora alkaliphila]